ncbi:MAG: DUF5320 domain-containing protein [Candidatus Nanoarchaeia archaeon]|nr:DUF5320 domain-containing protein [Candidatus Nanoarchaeia archaeon]
MPRGDGTGPYGETNWTCYGRGRGPCGRGLGRGLGRGYGAGFAVQPDEKEFLEQRKDFMEKDLEAINKRLKELEKKE